ncbi:hypothetical protein [Paenibacillus radicis (ex Gao et al. 2016)]|uniref:Uncharacterized protein n=1 Tax=Paenibacillus radicis (ex Gao et al. 2016) TaxID=1737354 RepID=A0A917GZZ5_9BACL|nr:hypothetical protein [Paenibacillus radicis (ex Gao et al. 2016)]GGG62376.1 hypothetical protein GCM10010918_15100 [Paenibacillus radicis (ex Gao et al. 2016)]
MDKAYALIIIVFVVITVAVKRKKLQGWANKMFFYLLACLSIVVLVLHEMELEISLMENAIVYNCVKEIMRLMKR